MASRIRLLRASLILAAVLALGSFTTLAVAWGPILADSDQTSIVTFRHYPPSRQGLRRYVLTVYEAKKGSATYRAWMGRMSGGCGNPYMEFADPFYTAGGSKDLSGTELPRWGDGPRIVNAFTAKPGSVPTTVECGSGWPSIAFHCTLGSARGKPSGGIQLGRAQPYNRLLANRILPYQPSWPGLAFNTLVFTGAWAALFIFAIFIRRARRTTHDRCPRCAYSLIGQREPGCSECGWQRVVSHA